MEEGTRRYESEKLQQSVRQLLTEGNNRTKIAEILEIHPRTVDRYIANIHEEDKVKWSKVASESLEDRAIKIKNYYEKIADLAEKKLDDPEISVKDLEIAGKLLIAAHKQVYEMLKYGPLKFTNSVTVEAKEMEDKSDGS